MMILPDPATPPLGDATGSGPAPASDPMGWRVACLLVIAAVVAGLTGWFCYVHSDFQVIDFNLWRGDWDALVACLHDHRAGQCQDHVSTYASAYLLNSLGVTILGRHMDPARGQIALNLAFLALPLLTMPFLHPRRRDALTASALYVIGFAMSPLSAIYVKSGALELQGGVTCGLFIATARLWLEGREVRSRRALVAILVASGLAFPLFKDTLVLTVAAAVVVMALPEIIRGRPIAWTQRVPPKLRAVAALVVVPALLTVVFNEVRYGVPWPAAYLEKASITAPPLFRSAEFLLGSVLSPNGGVLVFWSLPFFIVVAALLWIGARIDRPAVTLSLLVAAGSAVGFSRWWSSFGWDSWGDRLMILPMLSLLVVLVTTARPSVTPTAREATWRWCWPALPMVAYSALYFAVPYLAGGTGPIYTSLFAEPECQEMLHHYLEGGERFWRSEFYYNCAIARMLQVPRP